MRNQKLSGFTLLELLIVVLIVGILAAIAIGIYYSFSLESRRSDGINALLSISLAEEKYRTANTTYGTLAQVYSGTSSPQGYYTLSVSSVTATSYTITATAVGTQSSDSQNGTSCSTLTLTASNGTITQTPSACWPS